ncbi:hypothetical protein HYH02_001165 [Chlamydomonas schloesseri]|uniref:Protein kinase domain-containing protein n=1 Tax=Chlamydomonas schloesseri TaxID=2026947 RepID=A0A835WVE7_9CHLO|nr:hypothetical protein HYH02_001165 [Chlamydomonas schloesseri]|eukprot:KAG2454129.1 hypothetical protein HYH02_001165 [Chlamydomonas schloesseri]
MWFSVLGAGSGLNRTPGSRRSQTLVFLLLTFSARFTYGAGLEAASLHEWHTPDSFINAVAGCASRGENLADAVLVLDAAYTAFWSGLLGTDPSLQEAVPSVGGLWTWDESRLCRAALLTQQPGRAVGSSPAEPPGLVRFEGRPCAARLPYVCVPDAQVQAAGLTSSSLEWFRTHVRNASTAVRDAGATAASTAAVTGAATPLVIGSSSPHLLGPERSGLVLLRSGFALGGTRVPLGLRAEEWGPGLMNNSKSLYSQLRTSAFDDSELFWSRGPIVTAFFRSHNGRLLALRPVREKEAAVASRDVTAVGNRSTGAGYGSGLLSDGVFGASRPDLDGLSSAPYETHHVGPYQDYVVSVQGCFRTLAVEVLLLVTRSGRRYRLGRGSCSVWFREDAPPGGFLAGFAGLHIDVAHWSSQPPLPFFEGQVPNLPWLMQLELLWAAPAGSPPPVYTQRLPALLRYSAAQFAPPSSACPGAYPLASLNEEILPYCTWPWREQPGISYIYHSIVGVGCPSNTCCRSPLYVPGQVHYIPYNYHFPTCSADEAACVRSCQVQAGLCAVVPDRPALQFAVTSSPSAAQAAADTAVTSAAALLAPGNAVLQQQQQQQQPRLYIMYPDTHVSYEAAADMCRGITHLGLAWRLVAARDVLSWTTVLDLRNPAYTALTQLGYFWLDSAVVDNFTSSSISGGADGSCTVARYGSNTASSGAEYDTITYDSSAPCDGVGAVVCTLTAPREPPAAGGSVGAAGSTSTSSSLLVPPASRHTSRAWSAGQHRLTQSRRVASGNFGNFTCSATLLEAATSNLPNVSIGNAGSAAQLPALAGRPTVVLTAPPRAFLISTALQVSEAGNSVSAVSGLGMELAGVGPADSGAAAAAAAGTDPAAATVLTAGNPSTRGWHRLELLPEEVVVAASGCAGGHLELLLLHTSLGRVLAPPLTAGPEGAAGGSAACTSSFAETAPAGAYLVGFQVTFGHFIESMRLLWGQPLLVPSPGTAAANGTGGSGNGNGAASTAGSEGRGGALSSAVAVGSGSGGAADTHTAGPSQEGPQSAAPGDQPSSVPRLDVVAGPASNSSVGGGGGDGGSVSPAVIGGAVAAAAALMLAAAAGTALFMRQRRQRRYQQQVLEKQVPAEKYDGHGDDSNDRGTTSTSSSGGRAAAECGSYSKSRGSGSRAPAAGGSKVMCSSPHAGDCTMVAVPSAPRAEPLTGGCGGGSGVASVTLMVDADGGPHAAGTAGLGETGGTSVSSSRAPVRVLRYPAAAALQETAILPSVESQQEGNQAPSSAGRGAGVVRAAAGVHASASSRCFDAMATAPAVTRHAPLRPAAAAPAHSGPQPQQSQPLSQRLQCHAHHQVQAASGRDASSCHSGPGSSRSRTVSSMYRFVDSNQLQRAGTASWAVSPTINITTTETTLTGGVPSASRWEHLPLSIRWDKLPQADRLEQLPTTFDTSTQSLSCASSAVGAAAAAAAAGGGGGGGGTVAGPHSANVAAVAPTVHVQQQPPQMQEEDFHGRLCAYISSCLISSSSLVDHVPAVDAESHAAAAAPATGAGDTAGVGLRHQLEESLHTAQAELATRQPAAQGERERRPDLVLTTLLGSGSFGVVFHGTWRGLRVAVKTLVVHDSLMGAEVRRRHRAILEAAISKSLNHLNVVTTYETKVIPLSVPAAARQQQQQQQRAALQPEAGGPGLLGASAAGEGSSAAAAGATSVSPGDNAAPGVLDATTDTYKLLLVMEYCDAGSLARALGGAAGLCALTLALDVACGMRHIHSRNIIHGDLSAGNILLSSATARCHGGDPADADVRSPLAELWMPPLVAKVADFGLSVHMGEHQTHASNRYQGTPAYTAPEVLSRGRLSAASDVWSFGCILLELTHGERISRIRARTAAATSVKAVSGVEVAAAAAASWTHPPPGSPPRLAQLLAGCLSMDPGARPSFSQVVEVLVAILIESHESTQRIAIKSLAKTCSHSVFG